MGYQTETGQWWKTPVLLEEYSQVNSPYNTYVFKGLPPTPICLPSKRSMDAAVTPTDTDYLYFVARGDGSSQFSHTLAEHNRAVRKFQLDGS